MRTIYAVAALAVAASVMAQTGSFAQTNEPQPLFTQDESGPVYRLNDGTVIRFGRTPPADRLRIDVREALRPPVTHGPSTPPPYCFNASPYC